jgi:hypothetical protein
VSRPSFPPDQQRANHAQQAADQKHSHSADPQIARAAHGVLSSFMSIPVKPTHLKIQEKPYTRIALIEGIVRLVAPSAVA